MKKTKWFAADVKPILVGVYETDARDNLIETFQHWNGERWGCFANTPAQAEIDSDEASCVQFVKWRGLAEDPNKKDEA